ncbi:MAG: hypothetical protein WCI73_07745 [Phycisphaerae bacterium]
MNRIPQNFLVLRCLGLAVLCLADTAALLGLAWRTWHQASALAAVGLRAWDLLIAQSLGASLCIALAMYVLNVPRRQPGARWYLRGLLELPRRFLLVAQMATTATAVIVFGTWFLGYPLPLPK